MIHARIIIIVAVLLAGCDQVDPEKNAVADLESRVSNLESVEAKASTAPTPPVPASTLFVSWADSSETYQHTYPNMPACETARRVFEDENAKLRASIGNELLAAAPHFARTSCIPS